MFASGAVLHRVEQAAARLVRSTLSENCTDSSWTETMKLLKANDPFKNGSASRNALLLSPPLYTIVTSSPSITTTMPLNRFTASLVIQE